MHFEVKMRWVNIVLCFLSLQNSICGLNDSDSKNVVYESTESVRKISERIPKCCPPKYVFSTREYRCMRTIATSIYNYGDAFTIMVEPFGLNCSVVKAYEILKEDINEAISIDDHARLIYKNVTFNFGQYCMDNTIDSSKYALKVCYEKDYCSTFKDGNTNAVCLKKCCPDGHVFVNKICTHKPTHGVDFLENFNDLMRNMSDDFAVLYEKRTCKQYIPREQLRSRFHIENNGSFFIYEYDKLKEYTVDQQMYCMDYSITHRDNLLENKSIILLCYIDNRNQLKFKISKPMVIFSCVCHLITTIIYIAYYKLKKVIQRAITSFCLSQTISYVFLVVIQFNPNIQTGCRTIGFIQLFTSLAAFMWLNVIAFDIWRTFRSMKAPSTNPKRAARRITCIYCAYAWGLAGLITIICYLDNVYYILPSRLHPYLGRGRCMLEGIKGGNYAYLLYFTAPTTIVIVTNIIFFFITCRYYIIVKANLRRVSQPAHELCNDSIKDTIIFCKKMLKMAVKLFAIMGGTWLFEAVTALYDFRKSYTLEIIEIVLDSVNCLQGFLILITFVNIGKILKAFRTKGQPATLARNISTKMTSI